MHKREDKNMQGLNKNSYINRFLGIFGLRLFEVAQTASLAKAMRLHLNPADQRRVTEMTNAYYADAKTRKSRPSQILGIMPSGSV